MVGTEGFKLGSGLVELVNDFTVAAPGTAQLFRLAGRHPLQTPAGAFMFGLDFLMTAFEAVETLPELGLEPLGSLFL